jgi:cysteine desulfurase
MNEQRRSVYLDHNATTPLHPEVKKVLAAAFDTYGNPSSLHEFGRRARQMVEESRERVAAFIGARSEEIVFSGSGSEANNTVMNLFFCQGHPGCDPGCASCARSEVVTTAIEHPCVLESAACLTQRGLKVSYARVDSTGKVDLDHLRSLISERTGLVSVMTANNEIGTIQDIPAIARIAHDAGALLHTDAVQAFGKIPVNVQELGVDYLTFSAHKIYGPKGIGGLYVRKGTLFCPFIRGGHQERGRRAGTENTLGIAGLAEAVRMREREMQEEYSRLLLLKQRLIKGITENIKDVSLNGHPADSLPGTVNVSFSGAEGEAIVLYLDMEGIAVSTGSACASGSLDPSHVLMATGVKQEQAHGSIRMSMGRDTTQDDVDYTVRKLSEVVKRVRSISTLSEGVRHE